MPTIGQRFEQETELHCARCGHLHIVAVNEIVRPCTVCMHIEFDPVPPVTEAFHDDPVEIGLSRDDIEANVRAVLRARGGFEDGQIDALTEAIARSMAANNRRLQDDIEAAFRSLES